MKNGTHHTPKEFEAYFVGVVTQAAEALVCTVDATLQRAPAPQGKIVVDSAGVVGFVGADIRGLFSFAMARTDVDSPPWELHEDKLGELANQLAGRVKNQLSRVGVLYEVSPPVTLRGRQVSIVSGEKLIRLIFSCASVTYSVQVALEVFHPVELAPVDAEHQPADEGDLILF